MKFLPNFPATSRAQFFVQHMPEPFTSQFTQQLAEVCRSKCRADARIVTPNQMYVCPGSHHKCAFRHRDAPARRWAAHIRLTAPARLTLERQRPLSDR